MVDLVRRLSRSQNNPLDRSLIDLRLAVATNTTTESRSRQQQKRLTPSVAAELVDQYRSGDTVEALAAHYGIHRTTVMAHLRRAGIARQKTRWTSQTTERARRLYESGLSIASVSAEIGHGRTAVWNHLRAAGVQMRPQPGGAITS